MLGPAPVMMTDGMENAFPHNSRQQLFKVESQQDGANGREHEVVQEEERLQPERRAITHEFPAAEDDGVVYDNENARFLQGRHGCSARLEPKLRGWVAHRELKRLV